MKRTKRLIALLLVCASICTLLPAVSQTANAITLTSTTGTADPGFVTYYDDFESYTSQEEYNQVWQDIPMTSSVTSPLLTPSSLVTDDDGTQSMKPGSGTGLYLTTVNPAYRGSGMLTQFKVVMDYKGTTEPSAGNTYKHYTIVPYKGLEDENYVVWYTDHTPEHTNATLSSLRFTGGGYFNGILDKFTKELALPVKGNVDAEITLTFDYVYYKFDEPREMSWMGTFYSYIQVNITAEVSGVDPAVDPVSLTTYLFPATSASDTDNTAGRLSDKFTAGIYSRYTMPATFKSISYTYAKGPKELAACCGSSDSRSPRSRLVISAKLSSCSCFLS